MGVNWGFNKEVATEFANHPPFKGTVEEHAERRRGKVKLGEPKYIKHRETHIEYTENLDNAYKSISIETFMTFDELMAVIRELRGDAE